VAGVHYDVFISYRHGELDGYVAEKLHKMLENYRVPNAVAKKTGKKKLARVFRDREELPTSSDLSQSINEALANSDFLLVICSKRTCESQWVMREVETFGQIHGKDKIITLLIDGEPQESFPAGLREREVDGETLFVEPLAADIRAIKNGWRPVSKTRSKDWDASVKLLKEEKLRLLAPILGCAFDDLRRRHRRRRIQRIAACLGAAFAFALSFGAFSTYQYFQIDRQMQLKLENQSYVLAEYSAAALEDGDRDTALLLALEALPENIKKPGRPIVTAAEKALADALGIYDAADTFKPHKTIVLPASPIKLILSPGENYAAAVYPFEIAVFETETARVIKTLATVQSVFADIQFISDDIVVFSGTDGLTAYDIAQDSVIWQNQSICTSVAVSKDKSKIAAVSKDEDRATLYSSAGHKISEISFGGKKMRVPDNEGFMNPHNRIFELDGNGANLAVSFSEGSLSVFDTSDSAEVIIYKKSNAVYFTGGFYDNALFFSVVEKDPYYSGFFIYDIHDGAKMTAGYESDSNRFLPVAANHAVNGGLYVAFDDRIMSADVETGSLSPVISAGGRVESFAKGGDFFMISESGGDYRFIKEGFKPRIYKSGSVCNFTDIGKKYALTGSNDSKTARILKKDDLSNHNFFTYDRSYQFTEAKINQNSNRVMLYSYNGLRICDLMDIISEVIFIDPEDVINTQYDKNSGNLAVIYKNGVRLYSGLAGKLLLEKMNARSVLYTNFGISILDEIGDLIIYDLQTGSEIKNPDCEVMFHYARQQEKEIVGAGKIDNKTYGFAVSDGNKCTALTVINGVATEKFTCDVRGRAEVYFTGKYVFVSPWHGDAAAYTLDGRLIRTFINENGYMAEPEILGELIAAKYVSAASAVPDYSLILTGDRLETILYLPGFTGAADDGTIILDDGEGNLQMRKLYDTPELIGMAKERLGGRTLTNEEKIKFKAR